MQATDLVITENQKKTQKTFKDMVPEHYHQYMSVFDENTSKALPPSRKYDHAIDLKPDAEPTNNCKVYPLNPTEQQALDAFLDDMLACDYIHPSKSPLTSPFFFVKKKDGKLQPIQDYHQLNKKTICNQYPLPLMSDVVDKLQNASIFTKFDVCWGYNNVCIKEGDKWKATFKMNKGMFEPQVMFFGLTNLLATFQAM